MQQQPRQIFYICKEKENVFVVECLIYTFHDYLKKISIKVNMVTDEDNGRNETWHWTNDETEIDIDIYHHW